MSMTSDLAATSPLLLQLLIPQGFTLQSSSAQTQSQTQAPWLQRDPLLALLLSPQGPGLWTSHVPILQPLAPGTTPTSIFFFLLLSDYNKQPCEKPNSGTAEPALCPGSRHSMRGSQHAGVPTHMKQSLS